MSGREHRADEKVNKRKRQKHSAAESGSLAGDIVYYVSLVILVVAIIFWGTRGSDVKMIGGYSAMTVLTSSMQSEIPQGSLVINRLTNPEDLSVGDDITYMAASGVTITHRIIAVIEKYELTGQRAFITQGIENPLPDSEPVQAGTVVGKVVFHNHVLGIIITFIKKNLPLIIFAAAVLAGLLTVLRRINARPGRHDIINPKEVGSSQEQDPENTAEPSAAYARDKATEVEHIDQLDQSNTKKGEKK